MSLFATFVVFQKTLISECPLKQKFVKTHGKLINNIDLLNMQVKQYKSFYDFRQHIHGSFSMSVYWTTKIAKSSSPRRNLLPLITKKLIKRKLNKRKLIESLQYCTQCHTLAFEEDPSALVYACNNPHPTVWAKAEGYPEWPAKLMAIRKTISFNMHIKAAHEQFANVREQ